MHIRLMPPYHPVGSLEIDSEKKHIRRCTMCTSVVLLCTLLIPALALFYHFMITLDFHKVSYNHRPGICKEVTGPVYGSEDIELILPEGMAFITSGVMCMMGGCPAGKMFLYDFNSNEETPEAKELKIVGEDFDRESFFPHGLTSWKINGIIRLYVISHSPKHGHTIEVFDYNEKESFLRHKKTIKNEALISPNDLVAVGPDQFVYTNDGTAQSLLLNLFHLAIRWRTGSVYYFDAQQFHKLLDGQPSPNGIMYDKNKKKLFVSMISSETINVYNFSPDRPTVKGVSHIAVYSGCDNHFLHEDGSLYVACHPNMYQLIRILFDSNNLQRSSPSHVLHLRFDDSYSNATITEIYSNDGSELSGSATAVLHKNQLLIGSICRNTIVCHVENSSVL